MNTITRTGVACTLLGCLTLFAVPASAALIVTQPPCTTGGGPCRDFGSASIPDSIRTILFNAPSKGRAAASFTGSMFCGNNSSSVAAVADFVTQIVPTLSTNPNLAGPSALRHATRLAPSFNATAQTFSTTFNLASTRVFGVKAAGEQRYHFNLAALRMDATMNCTIYDAAFTVIFTP